MDSYSFCGKWICPERFSDIKPKNVFHRQLEPIEINAEIPRNSHILYRKCFLYGGGGAVIRISADDYYKLYINGKFITSGPCACFNFNYYYNEIDITDALEKGKNTIAVHSYYQGLINRVWVSGDDRLGLIFDITEEDSVIAKSDETVKCRIHTGFSEIGIIGYDTQFMECQDSRSTDFGFEGADYDDSLWESAAIRKYADYDLVKQSIKQLEFANILPESVKETETSVTLDFGSIYAGYLEAEAVGERGAKLTILFGQELDSEGEVCSNLRAGNERRKDGIFPGKSKYLEEWILSGNIDRREEFDYKSFRYAKIVFPKGTRIKNIRMTVRHYPFSLKKSCVFCEKELKDIWELCVNTLKYGVQDGIFDCIEREKGQYLGDGALTSTAYSLITGDALIMERLIDEIMRTDFINRGFMTCAPCSFMQEIAEYSLMMPQLLASHYAVTGDVRFLSEHYGKITEMLDFFRESYEKEDGFLYGLDKWCVVDWPPNARDGYDFDLSEGKTAEGTHNVINAYYIGAIKITNRLAKILKREPYRDTKPLINGYINAFYDSEKKLFRDTPSSKHFSLASNAIALRFELCPSKEAEEKIVEMILEKDAECSAFFITFASLLSLLRLGKKSELKSMLLNDGRWRRMLREGATVTFEAWGKDVKWNTSLFHLCYSYAVLFMTEWNYEIII